MKATMTARRMRVVLIVLMLLIMASAVAGFIFARKSLTDYASAISRLNADAQTGDQNIQTLKNVQERLREEQTTVLKAKDVVAGNADFTDKVIADLTRIGRESGVTINSFEFNDGAAAAATAPAAAGSTTTPPQQAAAPTVESTGIIKRTVTIDIVSPLSYTSFMTFLQKVEANGLKMQVTGVSMTKDIGNNIALQSLSIEVSVRR